MEMHAQTAKVSFTKTEDALIWFAKNVDMTFVGIDQAIIPTMFMTLDLTEG